MKLGTRFGLFKRNFNQKCGYFLLVCGVIIQSLDKFLIVQYSYEELESVSESIVKCFTIQI